eukprot:jgi/Chlat1/713/Chrsp104S01295
MLWAAASAATSVSSSSSLAARSSRVCRVCSAAARLRCLSKGRALRQVVVMSTISDAESAALSSGPDQAWKGELKAQGQGHLLDALDKLQYKEKDPLGIHASVLETQLRKLAEQLPALLRAVDASRQAPGKEEEAAHSLLPPDNVATLARRTADDVARWRSIGLKLLAEGKVAVLLLAGGQHCTKGLLRSKQNGCAVSSLLLVQFFKQGELPCLTVDDKVILESPTEIAKAPNGNGGVYHALHRSGCLKDMQERGVEHIHCFSVDNALVRVADPVFIGYCVDQQADCAAKVVAKAYPAERVGVFARRAGALGVVEYSEMPQAVATSVDTRTGELMYKWSNICVHYYSRQFLEAMGTQEHLAQYHLAVKDIPSVTGVVKGVKLEQFIFDAFKHAKKMALFEVLRAAEFAPVKNASGADSPETARELLSALHQSWVQAAGGSINGSGLVEVSPLLSLEGEHLQERCAGHAFQPPIELR